MDCKVIYFSKKLKIIINFSWLIISKVLLKIVKIILFYVSRHQAESWTAVNIAGVLLFWPKCSAEAVCEPKLFIVTEMGLKFLLKQEDLIFLSKSINWLICTKRITFESFKTEYIILDIFEWFWKYWSKK